jgi:hypothetical protein
VITFTGPSGTHYHHTCSSSPEGDVIFTPIPSEYSEDGEVMISMADILALAGNLVQSQKIIALEQMTPLEVLGLGSMDLR